MFALSLPLLRAGARRSLLSAGAPQPTFGVIYPAQLASETHETVLQREPGVQHRELSEFFGLPLQLSQMLSGSGPKPNSYCQPPPLPDAATRRCRKSLYEVAGFSTVWSQARSATEPRLLLDLPAPYS